jgi:streptogramin lyase/N-acetylneuraminic acid mutarotase
MRKIISLFGLIFFLASVTFAADINWIEKTPMPVPVGAFGYAVVDGNIYIIGGVSEISTTTVQKYNPATDNWEVDTSHGGTLAPLPQPRSVLFCGVINREIHAIGGWDENGTYRGDHFIYNPDTNTWSTGPSIPQYPIGQFAASVNNKIYVFGGWWGTYKNYVFEYSEGTGWTSKSPMPTARNHGTTGVYNGKIYVIAGQDGQPAQQVPLDVVEMYDPETNTWSTGLAAMPSPQHWLGSSGSPVTNGIINVLGPGNTAYGYDPQANLWKIYKPMPYGAVGVAALGGSIYAIGPEHTFQGIPFSMKEYSIPTPNSHPLRIDVDAEGRAWFTEHDGKKIGRFNPKAQTFTEYTTAFKPYDIVYNVRDGSVYFTEDEYSNGHYGILYPRTGTIQEFPTGLPVASAVDCTVDPSGNFWFNGWDSQSVSKISKTEVETYVPPSFGYTSGLTEDPQGNIWLTIVQAYEYNPRLLKLDTKLAQHGTSNGFTEISLPTSQATIRRPLAALGKIWFWNESKIACYDPDTGMFEEYPTTTPYAGIDDIAIDRWGRIWFTESGANQIGMLDLRTGTITEFPIPTPNSQPGGIAVDMNRDIIWFTESSGNKIGKLILSEIELSQPCSGDFDSDGDVDGSDLAVFSTDFGRTDCQ